VAQLGFVVDIYEGAVLVETVNTTMLPAAEYPIQMGDELVSVDGKSAQQLIAEFSKIRKRGNPLSTARGAADLITFRPQAFVPRASELGQNAQVVFRKPDGELRTLTIPWTKTGLPFTGSGPIRFSNTVKAAKQAESDATLLDPTADLKNWKADKEDHLFQGETVTQDGEVLPRRYLTGMGARTPTFAMPEGFVQRLGRNLSDFHFSGTFTVDGVRVGFLRVPSFGGGPVLIAELDTEIKYFNENTDVLIVDVMRNPGGGCYIADLGRRLIPRTFFTFVEEVRVTWDRIQSLDATIRSLQLFRGDQGVIDGYKSLLAEFQKAFNEGSPRTAGLPICTAFGVNHAPTMDQHPVEHAYQKPVIVLVDEFSISAADIFPGMMQDNNAALLVGTRTSGAGGSVSGWLTGTHSEALASNTNTLVVRRGPVVSEGYPTAQYVENVGVKADVQLNIMTRDNLMNRGKPFMDAVARIAAERARGQR
ncbi:MAG TPA: S41 family peptidase, partial [Bryobacteraceae bacterium]|nr:S41 family peptidase [Bryobacteraceae bacterium]